MKFYHHHLAIHRMRHYDVFRLEIVSRIYCMAGFWSLQQTDVNVYFGMLHVVVPVFFKVTGKGAGKVHCP